MKLVTFYFNHLKKHNMKKYFFSLIMALSMFLIVDASTPIQKADKSTSHFKIEKITTNSTTSKTPSIVFSIDEKLQKITASITFTDACGNELTVTGTCNACVNYSEWGGAFDNWWAANSTGGCYNGRPL
jgi:hypothetical protein